MNVLTRLFYNYSIYNIPFYNQIKRQKSFDVYCTKLICLEKKLLLVKQNFGDFLGWFDEHFKLCSTIFGGYNEVDAKRTPSYSSDRHFLNIASLSTFFYQAYSIVDLFTYFKAFSNIFSNILTALCRVYIIIPINVGLRFKRGCFQHPPTMKGVNLSSLSTKLLSIKDCVFCNKYTI